MRRTCHWPHLQALVSFCRFVRGYGQFVGPWAPETVQDLWIWCTAHLKIFEMCCNMIVSASAQWLSMWRSFHWRLRVPARVLMAATAVTKPPQTP